MSVYGDTVCEVTDRLRGEFRDKKCELIRGPLAYYLTLKYIKKIYLYER